MRLLAEARRARETRAAWALVLNHPGHGSQKSHGRKGGGVSIEGTAIRPVFEGLDSAEQVSRVASEEAQRITGRDVRFDLSGTDPTIAAEHATGILHGLEEFPDAPVERVLVGEFGDDGQGAFAMTSKDGRVIMFQRGVQADPAAYRRDVEYAQSSRHLVRAGGPIGVALHEFGHSVANGAGANERLGSIARDYSERVLRSGSFSGSVGQEISRYGMRSEREMIAEAFTDVLWNGTGASGLSQAIVDGMKA